AAAKHGGQEGARKFAALLADRVKKGEDFVKLAKEFDNGVSSYQDNAEGKGSKRGEIDPPEAEPVLFALRDGEVGPPVEIERGSHVARLREHRRAGRLPFDQKVQKQIRDKLRGEAFQREMKRIVNELKRTAVIEVAGQVK